LFVCFYIFWVHSFFRYVFLQMFSPSLYPQHSLNSVFTEQNLKIIMKSTLSSFSSMSYGFNVEGHHQTQGHLESIFRMLYSFVLSVLDL
jgi:hypothetical protein